MRCNPTLLLFLGATSVFAGIVAGGLTCHQPSWVLVTVAITVQGVALCAAYTVVHDASHHIASRNRMLNECMLLVCGLLFLFNPYLFRRLHLTHHAHTDEVDDPDLFTAGRNWFVRVFRASQLHLGYYAYALRHWRKDPRWQAHLVAGAILPILVAGVFVGAGKGIPFLVTWAVPLLLASTVLGTLISSAPHDASTHRTRNLNVPMILRWVLGNGHLHLAHHIAPTVPWYRLPAFWDQHQLHSRRISLRSYHRCAPATTSPTSSG